MTDVSLMKQVRNWHTGWANKGAQGLSLIVNIANQIANDRNWDAAAEFFKVTKNDRSVHTAAAAILHARFGDRLSRQTNKDHPSGYSFKMDWDANVVPATPNHTWSIVVKAVEDKESFLSARLHKALRDAEVAKETKPMDVAAYAKRLAKRLEDPNEPDIWALINALTAEAKGKAQTKLATVAGDKPKAVKEVLLIEDSSAIKVVAAA